MDDVLEQALRKLVDNHRCEFDDLVYTGMKQRGLLATGPFQNSSFANIEVYDATEPENWVGGLRS